MKKIKQTITLMAMLASSSLSALTLMIEDFDNYVDTSALHQSVFSFGSAAQAGKPSLAEGLGVDTDELFPDLRSSVSDQCILSNLVDRRASCGRLDG